MNSNIPPFTFVTPIFRVENLSSSLLYYQEKFGFDVAWQWSSDEAFDEKESPKFACVCNGEVSIFLSERHQGTPGAWLVLNVSSPKDVDTLHEEYLSRETKIVENPEAKTWGMYEMLVEDLDGNRMRIGAVME